MKFVDVAVGLMLLAGAPVSAQEARTVTVSDRSITDLHTGPYAATLIVLPAGSKVTAVDVGASESWAAAYTGDNLVRVKQEFGARVKGKPVDIDPPAYSNMNVQTGDGRTISFRLVPSGGPDWKVFVRYEASKEVAIAKDELIKSLESDLERHRVQVRSLEGEVSDCKRRMEALVDPGDYARQILADYRIGKAAKAPFSVVEVYRTAQYTYLRGAKGLKVVDASSQTSDGLIAVAKPLDKFWVQIGSKKALIERPTTEVAKHGSSSAVN